MEANFCPLYCILQKLQLIYTCTCPRLTLTYSFITVLHPHLKVRSHVQFAGNAEARQAAGGWIDAQMLSSFCCHCDCSTLSCCIPFISESKRLQDSDNRLSRVKLSRVKLCMSKSFAWRKHRMTVAPGLQSGLAGGEYLTVWMGFLMRFSSKTDMNYNSN